MPDHAKMNPVDPIINAVVLFEGEAPTRAAVESAILPLFEFERFRSRKVKIHDDWYWEVLPSFDARTHVIEDSFKGASIDDLFLRLEVWSQKPLHVPADGPAFEFALLRNQDKKGPSAVICRINHAIGDGVSLAKLIPHVFKDINGQSLPIGEKFRRREAGFKPTFRFPFTLLFSLFKVLGTPTTAFDTDVGLTIPDKKNITFTGRRCIVRIPTVKLSFIKSIKNAANVTVNDVVMSAVAGAVHRFRCTRKDPMMLDPLSHCKVRVRALMPVALPRQEGDPVKALRNKWSFASVAMPVGVKGSLERLHAANATMTALKNSPIVIVQNMVEANLGARLPWTVAKQTAFDSFVRHTFVFSNVPGPNMPITFAGREVTGLYMAFANLIPQVFDCVTFSFRLFSLFQARLLPKIRRYLYLICSPFSLPRSLFVSQVGALSLNGKIFTCLVLDDAVTPGARELGEHFIDELMDLARRTGLENVKKEDIFG